VSRALAGITSGNISACQAAVADIESGPRRAETMGRVGAAIGLGIVIGPALGAAASWLGPSAAPLVAAALATADLISAYVFMPETRRTSVQDWSGGADDFSSSRLSQHEGNSSSSGSAAGDRSPSNTAMQTRQLGRPIFILLFIAFLSFVTIANINTSLALLVHVRFGWGQRAAALLFTLFGLGSLAAQAWLIRPATERFGPVRLITGSLLGVGAGMIAVGLSKLGIALSIGVTAVGLCFGFVGTTLWVIASERAPAHRRGAVLGLVQSAGGLGRTVGPLASGMLFAHAGIEVPFLVGAGAALLAAGGAAGLWRGGSARTAGRG
jgi:MFS transporter, DHA1 family, tetracycline resistance protein